MVDLITSCLLFFVAVLFLGNIFDWTLALRFISICALKPFSASWLGRKTLSAADREAAFSSFHDHSAVVSTRDLDLMGHMNNARYPREADFARHELLVKCGLFDAAWKRKMPFVTAAQSIRYRKELRYRQRFIVRTRIVGWDCDSLFIEQLFLSHRKHHTHSAHHEPEHDSKYHIHCIMQVKETVAVPRHLKPSIAQGGGPIRMLFDSMGWSEKFAGVAKVPPPDFEKWLHTLHDSHKRVALALD